MDIISQLLTTYSDCLLQLPFSDYLRFTLQAEKGIPTRSKELLFYKNVYLFMTSFKKDFFYLGEMYYFLCQLLFQCRFAEIHTLRFSETKDSFVIYVCSVKGTADRIITISKPSPLVSTMIDMNTSVAKKFSYKEYSRSLIKSNPNFYTKFDRLHLTLTHIPRHFYCQVMKFVLKKSNSEITKHMGWHREDTVLSYLDRNIFRSFKHD